MLYAELSGIEGERVCHQLQMTGSSHWQKSYKKPYYKDLYKKVLEEYRTRQIFPNPDDIFNAFHLTPLKDVKVVILGQDPYSQ